ncbi:serine/threonine-protein kinase [Pseudonocardia xishanensis]|uniref:non-specific serine/threonine protein kinase n=1 Tax=Pseudonocardia xishanensis TaxID=630995 RepID=A0ABP8RKB6_9PSEU
MIPSRPVGGRYVVLDGLGAGAMGPVWRAQDKLTGKLVVVRELRLTGRPGTVDHTRFRDALLRQARIIGALADPGLLAVQDVLHADGVDLLVTEYAEGIRLSDHVSSGGPLSADDGLELARGLLGTLDRAHGRGLVHGGVRPEAIMLAEDGRIAFSDTGLASALAALGRGDTGLPDYGFTAPERRAGGPPTAAGDLWSFGSTLLRTSALEPPLADVVDRLRAEDPAARPTAAEALEELAEAGERRRTWFGFRRA